MPVLHSLQPTVIAPENPGRGLFGGGSEGNTGNAEVCRELDPKDLRTYSSGCLRPHTHRVGSLAQPGAGLQLAHCNASYSLCPSLPVMEDKPAEG